MNQTGNGYFWVDVWVDGKCLLYKQEIKVLIEMFWETITAIMDSRL